jgi:hypothetical protein
MEHYGNVVLATPEQCWRMVLPDRAAKMRHSMPCAEPPTWVGRHQWGNGTWVKVWSCEGHVDELIGAKRLTIADGRRLPQRRGQ